MKRVAVLYTTSEGQTQRIAEHMADRLRLSGVDVDLRNLKSDAPPRKLSGYASVILAASVHVGHHQREMVNFVRARRDQLQQVPAYFVSVTLSQAGAQRSGDSPEKHKQFEADVDKMIADFSRETGWRPKYILPVAGAILYTQYNFIVRFVMRRIAAKAGAATDTSHDHAYTDWDAVDRFTDRIAQEFAA